MTNNEFKNDFNEAMGIIKSMGFVKTNNLRSTKIYQYKHETGTFEPYSKENLSNLFKRIYKRSYTSENWFYPVYEALPMVDFNKVENYYKYCKVKDNTFNIDDLGQELHYYLEVNNKVKKDFKPFRWSLRNQKQQLINNNVFSNGKILLKYAGGYDFKILAPKDLGQFFRGVDQTEHLSIIGLQDNYAYFVENLVNIGVLFHKLQDYNYTLKVLNDYEEDYNIIKSMIDNFN